MRYDSDILIVGGGLNGPVLALALAHAGLTSTVIDAHPQQRLTDEAFNGKSYALSLASVRLLKRLDLWDALAPHAQPMREIKVSDGRSGEGPLSPFHLHFDHAELEEGPMGHMVEDRHLRAHILQAISGHPMVTCLNGNAVTAQQTDMQSASVTLASGQTLTGPLLVGADGRQSGTAARAGITRTGWDYGQTALVCAIHHERPHDGIAHQFFMPPGPLAILPLTQNRSSIVWSETHATAAAFSALSDEDYLTMLRPRFGDFLGDITLAGARYSYPLNLTLADSFVARRVALVGDAAHGLHPIAGQGLNAGLRDIAALAQVLSEARKRGEDYASDSVLARYQQWRRFDTATLALATDVTNRVFASDNPLLRLGRDIGMGVVNAIPSLRRGLMREAAGLRGDVPDLMRG